MISGSDQITFASLIAENQRLRSLVERLHDHFSPADCERFPQHGEEICRVFFMDPAEQDSYWFNEARRALGPDTTDAIASRRIETTPHLLLDLVWCTPASELH
jgi:hypothetical protein